VVIIYDKSVDEITGYCSSVYDSGRWREPSLEELYPNRDLGNLGFVCTPDDLAFVSQGTANWRLRKDENGVVVGIEQLPALLISCDACDTDGDGIPDVPADGESVARVTVSTADNSDVDVTFRTTRGALSHRTVTTKGGKAVVSLRAATETVAVAVTASAKGYRTATLNLELIPIPGYEAQP
jgi:hypothetical protein